MKKYSVIRGAIKILFAPYFEMSKFSIVKRALVILFVPMCFASFIFLVQFHKVYTVLKNSKNLKMDKFILEQIVVEGDYSTSFTDYLGEIDGKPATIWRGSVRSFTRQYNSKIGDTIYVWYNPETGYKLPRNKEEIIFKPTHYMFEIFPWFVFTTIPTYILLIIIYKRLKKNYSE